MGSSGKKKTTMAKLARENKLRERRLNKQAKKDARREAPSDRLGPVDEMTAVEPDDVAAEAALPDDEQGRFGVAGEEPSDPREKEVALTRLRDSRDEELAVFEGKLRDDALDAGASEQEMREAQRLHPGHGG